MRPFLNPLQPLHHMHDRVAAQIRQTFLPLGMPLFPVAKPIAHETEPDGYARCHGRYNQHPMP